MHLKKMAQSVTFISTRKPHYSKRKLSCNFRAISRLMALLSWCYCFRTALEITESKRKCHFWKVSEGERGTPGMTWDRKKNQKTKQINRKWTKSPTSKIKLLMKVPLADEKSSPLLFTSPLVSYILITRIFTQSG